jgi:hypothetical protein
VGSVIAVGLLAGLTSATEAPADAAAAAPLETMEI